eukprot:9617302-Alexandrium_andersonii.AAC.1
MSICWQRQEMPLGACAAQGRVPEHAGRVLELTSRALALKPVEKTAHTTSCLRTCKFRSLCCSGRPWA